MPVITTAAIATTHGSRYLQQLCKHWSHRFTVDFTPETGTVALPSGPLVLHAEPDRLSLTLTVADPDEVERMQGVVARHLDRFAFREAPLAFDWTEAP